MWSYMASAWASFACYFTIMVLSYAVGQKYLKVPYDLKAIGGYFAFALALLGVYVLAMHYLHGIVWACYLCRIVLLAVFALVVYRLEGPKLRRKAANRQ